MPATISRDDLRHALAQRTVTLVEALPLAHHAAGHLPGALHLPDPPTAAEVAHVAPDRTRTLVVYCSGPGCRRSTAAAAALTRLGYADVRVYVGGKADWVDAGLPLEADAPPPARLVS